MQDDRGILRLSGRLWYARRVLPGRQRLASADRMKNYPGYRDIGLRSEQVEAIVLYRSERRSMSRGALSGRDGSMRVKKVRMGSKDPGPGRQRANGCSQEMSWEDRGWHPGIRLE